MVKTEGVNLVRILAETALTDPEGRRVVYRLAKEPGRGHVVIREVCTGPGCYDRETVAERLPHKKALEAVVRLKARDRAAGCR